MVLVIPIKTIIILSINPRGLCVTVYTNKILSLCQYNNTKTIFLAFLEHIFGGVKTDSSLIPTVIL